MRKFPPARDAAMPPRARRKADVASGGPLQRAAGLGFGRRGFVPRNHIVDAEQILGIVLAVRHRLADEGGGHQLVVALAVLAFVWLPLDFGRQLEVAERSRQLQRIYALL